MRRARAHYLDDGHLFCGRQARSCTHTTRHVQELNDLLVQVRAVPCSQNAVLLWTLLLDGSKLLEDVGDTLFLLRYPKLRVSDQDFTFGSNPFGGIVLAEAFVAVLDCLIGRSQYYRGW
jgi:hypothetical protein